MTDNRTTIRNIDLDTLEQAREIVRENTELTMGDFVSDALDQYIDTLPFVEDVVVGGIVIQ